MEITNLFLTVCSVNNLSIVKLLIEYGYDFKKDNRYIIVSVCNDSIDIVKYFYDLDTELKQNSNTYFNLACDFGSVNTAKFLLQVGADPSVNNWESFRNACRHKFNTRTDIFNLALDKASKYIKRISSRNIINVFLESGIPNHIINEEYSNAIASKNMNIIYLLHKFGGTDSEIDEKIEKFWQDKDYDIIYTLCGIGVNINNIDDKILHLKQLVNRNSRVIFYLNNWYSAYCLLRILKKKQNK